MTYTLPTTGRELLNDPLFRAAECRARGLDWHRTAKEVGEPCDDLRALALDYPDQWTRLYRVAQTEFFHDCGREGVHVARQHLRHEDPRVSLRAAGDLLRFFAGVWRHA